jgi:hypothetical protein
MRPMRRSIPFLILSIVLTLPAAASARAIVGISDQQASTFTNPLYAPLKMKIARYITPYDVMKDGFYHQKLDAWLLAAQSANQRVLIAFEHSYKKGRQKHAPSVKEYTSRIKAFHKAYPSIKEIQPWNEANRCQRTLTDRNVVGQPICHNPKRAAQYYMAARKVFRSRGTKITGLDILDQNSVRSSVAYVKKFLKYAHPRPKLWGFHNYSDTNRFSTKRTKALLKATRSGEVWLTETGGIVAFGKSFPFSEKRAAKAIGCMFTIAKNRRIKRLYVYQFNGAPKGFSFDAGLINPDGTARLGWSRVKARKSGACHK